MADISQSSRSSTIPPMAYAKAQLKLATTRLPSLVKGATKAMSVDRRKKDSWGRFIENMAHRYPENAAIKSDEGVLTYREYNNRVNKVANHFIAQGLKKGDTAVVFMENRPDMLVIYSAMAKIGVINSMINTNLRGKGLAHAINLNKGSILFIGEEMVDAYMEGRANVEAKDGFREYFVPDLGQTNTPDGMVNLKAAIKDASEENPSTTANIEPKDTIAYVFTSGTTGGKPKAAVITHKRAALSTYFNGMVVMSLKPTDTVYVPLPFFHTNALLVAWPTCFARGSALAIRRKFSASNFWKDVKKYDATVFCYVGELCRYLMNQEPRPDDADNPLTTVIGNGMRPDIWMDFKKRFGVDRVFEMYGAADSNLYFVNMFNFDCTVGTCRTPYAIVKYDVEADAPILDEKGFMQRVKTGETGLAIAEITDLTPFSGYTSKEATEKKILRDVFKKGDAWFHTGDLLLDMGYKHAQFVDRLGDTFRWKGENVSTTEVEEAANTFHQISEVAVYGVKMPGGDGRAGMAALLPEAGVSDFDFKGLAERFNELLPAYAVPKLLRIMNNFEKTATFKFKKFNLKEEGFDPDKVSDPLYVLLPGASQYVALTRDLHQEIQSNKYRF